MWVFHIFNITRWLKEFFLNFGIELFSRFYCSRVINLTQKQTLPIILLRNLRVNHEVDKSFISVLVECWILTDSFSQFHWATSSSSAFKFTMNETKVIYSFLFIFLFSAISFHSLIQLFQFSRFSFVFFIPFCGSFRWKILNYFHPLLHLFAFYFCLLLFSEKLWILKLSRGKITSEHEFFIQKSRVFPSFIQISIRNQQNCCKNVVESFIK